MITRTGTGGFAERGNGIGRDEGYVSRYLKVVCQVPGCGYQVRVTRKDAQVAGAGRAAVPGRRAPQHGAWSCRAVRWGAPGMWTTRLRSRHC